MQGKQNKTKQNKTKQNKTKQNKQNETKQKQKALVHQGRIWPHLLEGVQVFHGDGCISKGVQNL